VLETGGQKLRTEMNGEQSRRGQGSLMGVVPSRMMIMNLVIL